MYRPPSGRGIFRVGDIENCWDVLTHWLAQIRHLFLSDMSQLDDTIIGQARILVMEGGCERFRIHIAYLRSYPVSWVGSKSSFEGCHCLSCIGSLNFNRKRFGSKHLVLEFDLWSSYNHFHRRHAKICTGLDLCKEQSCSTLRCIILWIDVGGETSLNSIPLCFGPSMISHVYRIVS